MEPPDHEASCTETPRRRGFKFGRFFEVAAAATTTTTTTTATTTTTTPATTVTATTKVAEKIFLDWI